MKKRVKVLHIYRKMDRGGAETFIMNVYRKIDKNKIQFDFICTEKTPGAYDDEIRSMGGNIYYINTPSKRHPFRNIKELVSVFKKNGPYDVIHIPLMFYSGIICYAAKKAGIKNIIVHSHNSKDKSDTGIFRIGYRWLMRKLINKYSTKKIACGEAAGKFLFGSLNDVEIMNNGIEIDKFQYSDNEFCDKLKKELNIKNTKVIANIARFSPEKNHLFFIELGKYIKNKKINYKILLIGDGKLRTHIENEVKKNKLEDIIIFAGVRSDVERILQIVDVIVMPSLYEGFPVTIVEALASGTPCVLSNTISSETAIVPDMVSFIDLNDEMDIWFNKIKELSEKKYSLNEIKCILSDKGFNIDYTVKNLSLIYTGMETRNEKK